MRQGKYYNLALENGIYRTNMSGRTPLYRQSMIPLDGTPSGATMVRLRMDQVKHTIQDHRDAVIEHEAEQEALKKECEDVEIIDMCASEDEGEHIESTFESQGTQMDLPQGKRGEREISVMSDATTSSDPLGCIREGKEANDLTEEAEVDAFFNKELRRIREVDCKAREQTRAPGCEVPEVATPLTQRIREVSMDGTQDLSLSYQATAPSSDPGPQATGITWVPSSQEEGGYANGRTTKIVVEEEDTEMDEAIGSFIGPFAARMAGEEYDIQEGPTWEAALAEEAEEAARKVEEIMAANAGDASLQEGEYLPLTEVMRRLKECGKQAKGKRKVEEQEQKEGSEKDRTIGRCHESYLRP